ncbi:phosphonate ABC transporter ATP-binding protein [Brotaphodocola sp.]|uniref:phosphonate ABC transporter ATP-binding protein n=1 Tax=Brotaphodocola sp. TaxID=3073577 RepID=UPI003D7E4106
MIKFEHVSKVYPNGTRGLDDVDLTISDGEFVSVIGLSGAGKSTFLRSINRLNEISEGNIVVDGVSITKAGKKQLREIRRHIGLISQSFNLVKRSTVQKNVLSGRLGYYSTWKSILGLFTKEDYERTKQALESVGLLDKLHSRSDELSGGQQQRVSIARTLVQQADIILADEPVASLDPITSQKILKDLRKINREMGKTVIVNIHSVEMAKAFSDRILAFKSGKVVFDGTPEQLDEAELARIYGKNPAMNQDQGASEDDGEESR